MSYEVNMTPTDSLKEYEMNPRDNKRSVDKVVESIRSYGWKVPIVVDEDMVILAGHTRLKAAKFLGMSEVPVHIAKDLSEEQKKAFRIMDNKAQDFSEWDKSLLSKELQALSETDFDLELTGFQFDEIAKLTSDLLDFEEPEEIVSDSDFEELTDIQASNVRMVNLFLNQESEPYFQEMIMSLRERWKKENLTDAVFQAVQIAYNNENL
tara:strand:+ start:3510 stop:4136 length:627 start_codon:yes stop_codon:yes gene_type:complete